MFHFCMKEHNRQNTLAEQTKRDFVSVSDNFLKNPSCSLLVGASFGESVVVVVVLLVLLQGSLQLAFILLSGSEKSIAANATLLKEGGNH